MKKLAIILGIIIVLSGVALILTRQPPKAVNPFIMLNDGTQVRFIDVTFGTNHLPGLPSNRWLGFFPQPMVEKVYELMGNKNQPLKRLKTGETNLVVWLDHAGLTGGANVSRRMMLRPAGGSVGGNDQYLGLSLGNGITNQLHSIRFQLWPRRATQLECVILEANQNYDYEEIGSFEFQNPFVSSAPTWKPEPGTLEKQAGDLKVTLRRFVSGVNDQETHQNGPDGGREIVYKPATNSRTPAAVVRVDFESPRGTNETWALFNADLSDSTGNRLGASSRTHMRKRMAFSPVLWPTEDAWKLRLHAKRKTGFTPRDLLTYSNVPLPAVGATNLLNLTSIVKGIECRLATIRRAKPRDPDERGWSSRDSSRIRLEHDDLGETNQIDLVSMTLQPSGTILDDRGAGWSNDHHEYNFEGITKESTHIDLVYAVHQARFVEFLVPPNWATNQVIFPE